MKRISEIGLSPLPWRWSGACSVANARFDAIDGTTCDTRVCFTEKENDARFIVHSPRLFSELYSALLLLEMFKTYLEQTERFALQNMENTKAFLNKAIASSTEALELASGEKKSWVGSFVSGEMK